MTEFDVVIIGAGVTGAAAAWALSRYALRVCVVEREEDVCSGTSKANSGIVHAGFDAAPGSWKARMNVRGAALIRSLARPLDFAYRQNGSLVLAFRDEDRPQLEALRDRGAANGVAGLEILSGDAARALEPALSGEVAWALRAPTAGIVCPFGLTIALAENAADNGVEFRFLTRVENVQREDGGYRLETDRGDLRARYVVNAAGVWAGHVHNLVSARKLHITPRRGEYVLLDREVGDLVRHTVFQLPTRLGKGVLVTPTVHGNLLVGPNAQDVADPEDTETTAAGLEDVRARALRSVPGLPFGRTITGFAGLRAHEDGDDFVLGEPADAPGFFDAAGIESPGLTSAPAVGEYLAAQIARRSGAARKAEVVETRRGIPRAADLPPAARTALIRARPDYGVVVCRCEGVSEGEIRDAIHRTLGARSLDGVKRRVRQGMGRCQGGFCTPAALALLARELGIPAEQVTKNRPGSELLRR